MRIRRDFPGGNIPVKAINGNPFALEPERRGSSIPYFHRRFCVEGAQGKTLPFVFPRLARPIVRIRAVPSSLATALPAAVRI